jgi:hypothetical protein
MTQAITNDAGQVALKYYQPAQVLAQNTPTGTGYAFAVRASISMSWVAPDDVGNLLARRAGCNCGGSKKKQAFFYATESDVRRWVNGGGR